eukprot:364469-Chlamydomonas_euryale.AAC.1
MQAALSSNEAPETSTCTWKKEEAEHGLAMPCCGDTRLYCGDTQIIKADSMEEGSTCGSPAASVARVLPCAEAWKDSGFSRSAQYSPVALWLCSSQRHGRVQASGREGLREGSTLCVTLCDRHTCGSGNSSSTDADSEAVPLVTFGSDRRSTWSAGAADTTVPSADWRMCQHDAQLD